MTNKKILFLGGIFDECNKKEILENSQGVIQFAADSLQKSFIKGLKIFFSDIEIINLPFIGGFPFLYKKMFINFQDSSFAGIKVKNIQFCNLRGYKIFSRFLKTFFAIIRERESLYIIYSINISFLSAVYLNKFFFNKNRIVLIVPDLPEFMTNSNSFLKEKMLSIQNLILQKIIFPKIDTFVLLTNEMNERLKIDKKKIVLIEGIYSDMISPKVTDDENKFTILYTGTLAKRYGIVDLVEQFHKIEGEEYELLICGAGDGEEEIKKFIEIDIRIKLLGQVSRETVLDLQKNASLLINPRKPEEFTKFSFPSKTMEYFASGTPVLMYKLEGIPKEYFDFCYTLDTLEQDSICKKIISIRQERVEKRNKLAFEAQQFIADNKTEKQQVMKLFDHIKNYENTK